MTVISIPDAMLLKRQQLGTQSFDLEFAGGDAGASQVAILGPPRLTAGIASDEFVDNDQAALWKWLVLALKGKTNFLAMYDRLNPAPHGTLRGAPTVATLAPAGADTLVIAGGVANAFRTLKVGDWIGVNQASTNRQLLMVMGDATADATGLMTVKVAHNLRVAVSASTQVVWDKPTCLMRRNDAEASLGTASGAVTGGFSLDLVERWF